MRSVTAMCLPRNVPHSLGFHDNTPLAENFRYGLTYLQPSPVMNGRLVKLGDHFDF